MRRISKPFEIKFDPKTQPGYQTRHVSLDRFTGGARITMASPKEKAVPVEKVDLRKKFGTGQVAQLLPSAAQKGKK